MTASMLIQGTEGKKLVSKDLSPSKHFLGISSTSRYLCIVYHFNTLSTSLQQNLSHTIPIPMIFSYIKNENNPAHCAHRALL